MLNYVKLCCIKEYYAMLMNVMLKNVKLRLLTVTPYPATDISVLSAISLVGSLTSLVFLFHLNESLILTKAMLFLSECD